MPTIFDNIKNILAKGLNSYLHNVDRADFCVGYFNLRGWKEIAEKVEELKGGNVIEKGESIFRHCRLLVGMVKTPIEEIKALFAEKSDAEIDNKRRNEIKRQIAEDFRQQLLIGFPTNEDEASLKQLLHQLQSGKLVVKVHCAFLLHAKLYLLHRQDPATPIIGFVGSSNLTMGGLKRQGELNVDVLEQVGGAQHLKEWFDKRWDDWASVDISNDLIQVLQESWAGDVIQLPYHIFLKMAYHLSQEARAGLSEFSIPPSFRDVLWPFQKAAVTLTAKKLHQKRGAMLADVVGLGKTIEACAIAKMFEESHYYSTLIICPAPLVRMWEHHVKKYDLKAVVMSIGAVLNQLQDEQRFKLVIIDESHNLRNDAGSRYRIIREFVRQGERMVLLLTATPYNKTYLDLSNQLRLFLADDHDLAIMPTAYINEIGGQDEFARLHPDTFIRSIKAFERGMLPEDYRELMRQFMVRRTRSFIKEHHAETDESNGRKYLLRKDGTRDYFPDRLPVKVLYDYDPNDRTDQYAQLYSEDVASAIGGLYLARYGLGKFVDKDKLKEAHAKEKTVLENLGRAGQRLIGFRRTNLFKRLESSGYSFLLSLARHLLRDHIFLYAIENNWPLPIGKPLSENLDNLLEDQDPDEDSIKQFTGDFNTMQMAAIEAYRKYESPDLVDKFNWVSPTYFTNELKRRIKKDIETVSHLLDNYGKWDPKKDRQLKALELLLTKKHPKDKLIVFTQFADTAEYLFKELTKRKIKNMAVATGNTEDPTILAWRFSPVSNEQLRYQKNELELRILIATDVLSEGQNLQDAHIIVNYDLPWALIRLIQRAGRVDRIGQQHNQVICYSFLPEEGLEKIIKLRRRLQQRIAENAEVVGSDEQFFEGDPVSEQTIRDLYNEKAGILDDEEAEGDIDVTSYAYQIWNEALKANPSLKKTIESLPNVIFSTKQSLADAEGVLVYTKTSFDNDVLMHLNYKGDVLTTSPYKVLKLAECTPEEKGLPHAEWHHEVVAKAVKQIKEEELKHITPLGRKTGVKYRVYTRLSDFVKTNMQSLFVTDNLKKALDDMYHHPLQEIAKDYLSKNLKAAVGDETLATLVSDLWEENKLVLKEEEPGYTKLPQVICSMGLKS
jgi:superfamily II DNA or RNA helicase